MELEFADQVKPALVNSEVIGWVRKQKCVASRVSGAGFSGMDNTTPACGAGVFFHCEEAVFSSDR